MREDIQRPKVRGRGVVEEIRAVCVCERERERERVQIDLAEDGFSHRR